MEHDSSTCEVCQSIEKPMNTTSSNVTFLTLAIGSLSGVIASLQANNYPTAIGMFIFGVAMVYIYEKTPPSTNS